MRKNYATPKLVFLTVTADVITASAQSVDFDRAWLSWIGADAGDGN